MSEIAAQQIMEVAARFSDGQHRMVCPACAQTRSRGNQKNRTLSVQVSGGRASYTCWHCGLSGRSDLDHRSPSRPSKPVMLRPVREAGPLQNGSLAYLRERGIGPEAAKAASLFSTRTYFNKLGREGEAVGFPYFDDDGVQTGAKLRSIEAKDFTVQGTITSMFGSERTQPTGDIYIVEGEMDAVAMVEAGIINAISVPHGDRKSVV